MATQSLLANGGLRSRVLGSSASLAIAAPIADGDPSMAAHTAANRTGLYFGQTPGSEFISMMIGGSQGPTWTNGSGGTDLAFTGRLLQTGVAYTALPSGVELSDVILNESQTKQFLTTVPATQRAVLIEAPTYSCTGLTQTITTAATLAISGAPAAGTNVTITNTYALWVQAGNVLVASTTSASSATVGAFVVGNGTAATSVAIGGGTIIAGGSIVGGSLSASTGAFSIGAAVTAAAYSVNTTVLIGRGNSGTFAANSLFFQSGGTTTAGGGIYFGVNNGTTTSTVFSILAGGAFSILPSVITSGVRTALTLTGAADTTITTGTEQIDVNFALNRTVQWATTTPTTQRAVLIQAPTYACSVAGGSITNAATLAISGAPIAGANISNLSNSYAVWVQGGTSRFDGQVNIANTSSPIFITQSAASSGVPTAFSLTGGAHTTLTTGTEAISVNFNLSQTIQWATTTPATQRAFLVQAPTYSCNAVTQTITTAATFAITAAPAAGTNVTITTPLALWVQAGNVLFSSATAGTSTTAGALVITGGIATGGACYFGGTLTTNGGFSALGAIIQCSFGAASAANAGFVANGTSIITGAVTDGYTGGLQLAPTYNAGTALTITRHNYIQIANPVLGGAGPAAITDAAVFRFDAAAGTHKALAADASVAVTFTPIGPTGAQTTIQGWMKINVNGTLRYIPFW